MKKENGHLPAIGVGSLIVIPQCVVTCILIVNSEMGRLPRISVPMLKIPFIIIGALLAAGGLYLWYSANHHAKIFDCIEANKLKTDGIYGAVRNPIYSGWLIICTGAVFIENNMILAFCPVICYIYMTVMLINTEEKWLMEMYGNEYAEYKKRVNRCIPWFPKKQG